MTETKSAFSSRALVLCPGRRGARPLVPSLEKQGSNSSYPERGTPCNPLHSGQKKNGELLMSVGRPNSVLLSLLPCPVPENNQRLHPCGVISSYVLQAWDQRVTVQLRYRVRIRL